VIVNVHMADGRTVFQFAARNDLRKVLRSEADTEEPVLAWVRWNPEEAEWTYLRACHIRKQAIAFVVDAVGEAQGKGDLNGTPAQVEVDRRRKLFEEREAERAPRETV